MLEWKPYLKYYIYIYILLWIGLIDIYLCIIQHILDSLKLSQTKCSFMLQTLSAIYHLSISFCPEVILSSSLTVTEREMHYLIVLDAYCPGRQSLCYHLALRSDDCNRLIHRAAWNKHTHTHTALYNLLSCRDSSDQRAPLLHDNVSAAVLTVQYLREALYAMVTYLRPPGWGWRLSR